MRSTARALLFDMDGLLIDTETLHIHAYMELTRQLGKPQNAETLKQFIGHSHLASCRWLMEELGCPGPMDELIDRELAIYFKILSERRPPPLPGVSEMFGVAESRGMSRALVSSSADPQVDPTMDVVFSHLGRPHWRKFFHSICTGDRVDERKPAPDLYNLAVKELDMDPRDCVAFEDSPAGVTAAHAAGLRVVAIPNMYLEAGAVAQGKADFVFPSLLEAFARIDEILA